jgi:hypothetical protein
MNGARVEPEMNIGAPRDAEPDVAGASSPPKKRTALMVVIGLALVALIVLLSNLTGTRADISALNKMGVPTDAKSLEALDPTNDENAAILYEKAAQAEADLANAGKPVPQIPYSSFKKEESPIALQQAVIKAWHERKGVDDIIRQGARLPRCLYLPPDLDPADLVDNFDVRRRGYNSLFRVTNELVSASRAELYEGKTNEAMEDLALAENVSAQLARNPGFESFEAWYEQSRTFHDAWKQLLAANRDNRQVVETASTLIQKPFLMANIRQAAIGDFADQLDILKKAQSNPFQYKVHVRLRSESDYKDNSVFMRQAVNQMIHEWRLVFEKMPADPNDWKGLNAAFQKGSDDIRKRWPARELLTDPFRAYATLSTLSMKVQAMHRMSRDAANLLVYRLDHKSAPDTLPSYGEDSIDPFTNHPFNYIKVGSGFMLACSGEDGKVSTTKGKSNRVSSDDIVLDFGDR